MKKKLLAVLLTGAMAASLLAGCGSKNADSKETSKDAGQEAEEPVTLKTVSMFGGTDPNKEAYESINADFMKENGNITIEDNSQTSDEEWKAAVNADFSVGNEPDVIQFFTDATADTIVATGKLVSLEEIRAEYPDYAKDTLDTAIEACIRSWLMEEE